MQEHYGFNDKQMKTLLKAGVEEFHLMKCLPLFDPDKTGELISKINLYHYMDQKGDFTIGKKEPHKAIANVIYDSFEAKEKMEVLQYLDDMDSNFEDLENE